MDCAEDVIGHMSNPPVSLDTDRKVTVPLYSTPRLTCAADGGIESSC